MNPYVDVLQRKLHSLEEARNNIVLDSLVLRSLTVIIHLQVSLPTERDMDDTGSRDEVTNPGHTSAITTVHSSSAPCCFMVVYLLP